jgi:hypothetical protein
LRSLIASRTQQPIPPLTAHTPCQHRLPTR